MYTKAVSLGLDPNQVVAKITNNGYVPDRGISWDIKVTDPYAHYAHIRATQHLQHTTTVNQIQKELLLQKSNNTNNNTTTTNTTINTKTTNPITNNTSTTNSGSSSSSSSSSSNSSSSSSGLHAATLHDGAASA